MKMIQLPGEILLLTAECLKLQRDVNELCQTNRFLYHKLGELLYKCNVRCHGSSVPQWAALHGRLGAMEAATKHGADVNTMAGLCGSTMPGSLDHFCRHLRLELQDADVHTEQLTMRDGRVTLFILAAGAGYQNLVLCLLQHGANFDQIGVKGMTPLMVAAQGGYPDVVELLLHNGASPALIRGKYMTALDLAVAEGCVCVVDVLLRHGADPNRPSPYPVISRAAYAGYIDAVRKLLDHGADIQIKSHDGITPLLHAIQANHSDIIDLLLQSGEDIECLGVGGVTPLMHAVWMGSIKACERLIDLGADANAKDSNGRRPLWWALENRNEKIASMLLESAARAGGRR